MKRLYFLIPALCAVVLLTGCSAAMAQNELKTLESAGPDKTAQVVQEIPEEKPEETLPPSAAPSSEPTPSPALKTATIAAVGDVMLMSTQIYDAKTEDGFDFRPVFELIKPYIESADIAIANLETPVAGSELGYSISGELLPDGKRAFSYFNAPEEILDALLYAGFDVLGTANNHALDKNREGLEKTIANIRAKGLAQCGTNLPGEERGGCF